MHEQLCHGRRVAYNRGHGHAYVRTHTYSTAARRSSPTCVSSSFHVLQSAVIVIDSAESLEDALELVTLLRVCALDPPSPEARIPLLQSRVSSLGSCGCGERSGALPCPRTPERRTVTRRGSIVKGAVRRASLSHRRCVNTYILPHMHATPPSVDRQWQALLHRHTVVRTPPASASASASSRLTP